MANPFSTKPFDEEPLSGRPYDPEKDRERIRGTITVMSMLIFVAVIGVYLLAAVQTSDPHWTHIQEAIQAILPAVTSVLGTALGFYFGSQKR